MTRMQTFALAAVFLCAVASTLFGASACSNLSKKPGHIQLSATLVKGGEPIAGDLWWEVFKTQVEPGQNAKVTDRGGGSVDFELPAGVYRVTVALGQAKVEKQITVRGEQTDKDQLVLDAGIKRLSATMAEGGEAVSGDLWWEIFTMKGSAPDARKKLTDRGGGTVDFILPAGRYVATVAIGQAKAEKAIEVKAGETSKDLVTLNAGRKRLSASLSDKDEAIGGDLWWEIHAAEANALGERKKLTDKGGGTVDFILPAGRYLASVSLGQAKAQKEIEVKAGEVAAEKVVLGAGRVRLSAISRKGSPAIDNGLWWEIFESKANALGERKKVTDKSGGTADFVLPIGEFLVTVKKGEEKAQQNLKVAAGETKKVDVVLKKR